MLRPLQILSIFLLIAGVTAGCSKEPAAPSTDSPTAGDGDGGRPGGPGGGGPDGGDGGDGGDGDGGDGGDGGGETAAETGDSALAPLPCDPGWTFSDDPARADGALAVSFTHAEGFVYVDLALAGAGAAATAAWVGVESGGHGFVWTWSVTGLAEGVLELAFTADEGATEVARCQLHVVAGHGSGDGGDGGCVPTCAGRLCGEDDGCGAPCVGGYRDSLGAVSDCRAEGDCGCGVEPNENMECLSSGQCRVRCSCDCLPPQDVDAALVASLDYGGACAYVFEASGDPTVWDYERGAALCPTDYDPTGAARCTECPPCHRDHPPSCDWSQWCTCYDERWIDGYREECCAAGAEHCY